MGKIYDRIRVGGKVRTKPAKITAWGKVPVDGQEQQPDPKLKGVYGKNCNVTACQQPGATWWNFVMRKYYCAECAHEINYRPLDNGRYLCSPGDGTEINTHKDEY